MGVTSQHSDYKESLPKWQRCEDVAAGTDAVHAGAEKYLPLLTDQTKENYDKSLARTILFNATWRTIAGLIGMVFRKPPIFTVPAAIEPMLDDVTMSGESLFMVCQDVTEESLKLGRLGVLVDYPRGTNESISIAQAEAAGLRPFVKVYKACDIYNWKTGRVNNKTVLTEVRLKENAEIAEGEWDVVTEERYRVLSLDVTGYRVRVYKIGEKKEEILLSDDYPLMRGKPLPYIPFQFISTDDLTPDVDNPPLIDLVDMNLHHYRITSIKCNALPFAVPTMFIAGNLQLEEGEKIYVGSTKAIHSNDPSAHAEYIEYSGQGLGAVEKEIDKAEAQMAILGARMLEPQRGAVESAEGQSIHRKGEESILATVSQTISIGMTQVMTWFADWAGATGEIKIELNKDFYPAGMNPQMLTALLAGWQQGAYSDQTLFENLQQAEIINAETTLEEEQARIGESAPMMTTPEAAPTEPVSTEQQQMQDNTELIAAINALIAQMGEPVDQPVINFTAPPITIDSSADMATIGQMVADAISKIPAPIVNLPAPVINMPSQPITVNMPEQQPANVTVINGDGKKTIGVERDAEGNIIRATVQ
jgi:hypothetical protein